MYTKITVAITFMGPDWWLKLAIEEVYQDGIRNINLKQMTMVSEHVLKLNNYCLLFPYFSQFCYFYVLNIEILMVYS